MIKQFIKDLKGISWITPKQLLQRFVLVICFVTILTVIALSSQLLGGMLFKVVKG